MTINVSCVQEKNYIYAKCYFRDSYLNIVGNILEISTSAHKVETKISSAFSIQRVFAENTLPVVSGSQKGKAISLSLISIPSES